jgi:hypothetical protein
MSIQITTANTTDMKKGNTQIVLVVRRIKTMLLSVALNQKLLDLAPRFSVSENAPNTFAELKGRTSPLVVYSGASDCTIYGDPRINYAFRAWHDSIHLRLNAGFTVAEEIRVAEESARILGGTLGEIIYTEIADQRIYAEITGQFVGNQVDFMVSHLKAKGIL